MQDRIELPRTLESYFAFAETERGKDGRRFSITLPYLDRGRMDKLQWWWRIGTREEALLGEGGCEARRRKEVARFTRHVERWLANHGRCLYGSGPFPCLGSHAASGDPDRGVGPGQSGAASPGHSGPPRGKVANG